LQLRAHRRDRDFHLKESNGKSKASHGINLEQGKRYEAKIMQFSERIGTEVLVSGPTVSSGGCITPGSIASKLDSLLPDFVSYPIYFEKDLFLFNYGGFCFKHSVYILGTGF